MFLRKKSRKSRNFKEKGKDSEDFACEYLKKKGYKILERNFRTRRGEIDIIAEKDNVIVFVEVRSFSKEYFNPIETIGWKKIEKIVKTARYYLAGRDYRDCRFDVIGIIGEGGNRKIEHIENAFGYINI